MNAWDGLRNSFKTDCIKLNVNVFLAKDKAVLLV